VTPRPCRAPCGNLANFEEVEAEGFEFGEDAVEDGGVREQTGGTVSVSWC
jgi:hypothetical protein